MKTKINIYLLVVSLFIFIACDHNLDLTPDTSLTSDSFFEDEDQFDQALAGAYSNLRTIAFTGIYMDEMRSDNTFFTFYGADRGTSTSIEAYTEFMDDEFTNTEPNNPGDRYGSNYSAIAKVNTIISKLEDVGQDSGFSEEYLNQAKGEALFLRAFYYYDLVSHYGGVPLQLEEVKNEEEAYIGRSSIDEVYDQIINDLTTATPLLPIAESFPQSGKATRGAAKMLLAYAYMSKNNPDYISAEKELLDIVDMNYELLSSYEDNFDPNNKNNRESIFEVQYKEGEKDGQQSDFNWRFIPKAKNPEKIMGVKGTNLRGGIASGGWNVPTQEMIDSYEEGDLRLPVSIGVAVGSGSVESFEISNILSPEEFDSGGDEEYQYFINKYIHAPYETEWDTPENWPIFRYAGTLLLLAENLVQQGRESEALPYLNQVRERAGLIALSSADLEKVSNEMRHELAFENHRWLDLKRIGKAVEFLNAKGIELKKTNGWLSPESFNVTEDKLLFAIPLREIEINPDMEQNPGY